MTRFIYVLIAGAAFHAGCFSDPITTDDEPEALCDGVDDDDDGRVDDGFADLGEPCSVTEGICAGDGTFVCSEDGSTTVCRVDNANPPTDNEMTCDGLDNDCDGSVDEGCDDDGDGWCDANLTVDGDPEVCSAGVGDCDDEDASVNPDGAPACDGRDNDCDGSVDELTEAEQPVGRFSITRTPSDEAAFSIVASASSSGFCVLDKNPPTTELVWLDPTLEELGRVDLGTALGVTHPVALEEGGCAVLFQVEGAAAGAAKSIGPDGQESELTLAEGYSVRRRRTLIEAAGGSLVASMVDENDQIAIVTIDPDLTMSNYIDTNIAADFELQLFEVDGTLHGVKGVQEFYTIDTVARSVTPEATTGPLFDAGGVVIGTTSAGGSGFIIRYSGGDSTGMTFRIDEAPRTVAMNTESIGYDGFIFPSDFAEVGPTGRIYSFVPGSNSLLVDDQGTSESFDHSEVGGLLLTIRHSTEGVDLLHVVDRGAVDGSTNLSLSRYLCD